MERIERALHPLARTLWPDFDTLSEQSRPYMLMTAFVLAYALPLAMGGLVWLALVTDLELVETHGLLLIALFVLILAFKRLVFFVVVEIVPGSYGRANTYVDIVAWSAMLIFGPTVMWLDLISDTINSAITSWSARVDERWDAIRDLLLGVAISTGPRLLALDLYRRWGGLIPIPGFMLDALVPALAATILQLLLGLLLNAPMLALLVRTTLKVFPGASLLDILSKGLWLWFGANFLLGPVAVLVAALYTHSGAGIYFFFLVTMLAASLIGSRLSQAVEHSRQRSRELEQLERLGRAILNAPPDGTALPDLLVEHVPGIFFQSRVEVCVFPDETLVHQPAEWPGMGPEAWRWLQDNPQTHIMSANSIPPWGGPPLDRTALLVPIVEVHGNRPLGGVCVMRQSKLGPIAELLPATQSLAALVSSALHNVETYQETLAHQRTVQELTVAGSIQASLLPSSAPQIEGWQVSATLESARETSGDFFDLIAMWDGRLGIVIADVADKGLGAALYMALSRTLIRTYAHEYSTRYTDSYAFHPERVINTVNQCIMQDTHSDLFVTVFFGILDPTLSTLTYTNAGHNAPLLFPAQGKPGEPPVRALVRTGIPVGILPNATWERGSVRFEPGDVLVLYTDGVTEAENRQQEHFGEQRLIEVVQAHINYPAQDIRQALIDAVHEFVGEAPPLDDLALLVLRREEIEQPL